MAPGWLKQRLPRLYRIGFPRPLPLPWIVRWRPAALNQWLDDFREPAVVVKIVPNTPAEANDTAVDDADDWAAVIDRRAAALVRGE